MKTRISYGKTAFSKQNYHIKKEEIIFNPKREKTAILLDKNSSDGIELLTAQHLGLSNACRTYAIYSPHKAELISIKKKSATAGATFMVQDLKDLLNVIRAKVDSEF